MEWADKTSFDRLNKLFVISIGEWNHETMLTNQNLLTLVRDLESYAILNLPRFTPRVLVPSEHFVLKDLPFYEEAWATDSKARQDRLDKREKKCQEGTLRQAPGVGRPATSSTTHLPIKKKSVLQPAEKVLDLSLSPSFHSPSRSTEVGIN